MLAIIDYGAGNLTSVIHAVSHLGWQPIIATAAQDLAPATRIILPGVGHFSATQRLTDAGMKEPILKAIARGVPFLGICVGMQWLMQGSEESPETNGLGLLRGVCARFPEGVKAPHVGWNTLDDLQPSWLLEGVSPGSYAYFTHSYYLALLDETVAGTTHGPTFSSAVVRGRVAGVQFHPEKSGETGLRILRNFLTLPSLEQPC